LKMIPYVTPMALRVAIPLTALLAVSAVYGRMAADQEIVAIKSLGISPMGVMLPSLVFAVLVSLLTVYINDLAVSWGRLGIQHVVVESLEDILYRTLRSHGKYDTPRFTIHVAGVDGTTLLRPYMEFSATAKSPVVRIVARTAQLRLDANAEAMRVVLTDGVIERGDSRIEFRDSRTVPIPLIDAMRKPDREESPSQLALYRVGPETLDQVRDVAQLRSQMLATLSTDWATGCYESVGSGTWQGWLERMNAGTTRLHRLRAEPWRRWATGFSCLFFVVAATPLAILVKTANLFSTFAVCFFPILLVYYPIFALSVDRAKDGACSPIIVWSGNLVLGVVGLWLARKVVRC